MDMEELERIWIPHLSGQFERARPVLFTGAGFSRAAKNISGVPLPSVTELKGRLWELCFPGKEFDNRSSLQDIYEHALLRHGKSLADLMTRLLTVDGESLPQLYQDIFSMPWLRTYTLNIDDLATAASRKFGLPRKINEISAVDLRSSSEERGPAGYLDVIHLNGTLSDLPDRVTFSTMQYAQRLATEDRWYIRFCGDLLTSPVVFIGTELEESPLWQHVAMRHGPGRWEMSELRHRSYLVTPNLSLPKQSLLSQFNVVWIPMTAQDFTEQVLERLKAAALVGHRFINQQGTLVRDRVIPKLREVSELASNINEPSDFLSGQEPVWADIVSNRAITRQVDDSIWQRVLASRSKSEETPGVVVITGTAGAGKSASLKRLALRLAAGGTRVAWVDRESDFSPGQLRFAMREEDAPRVLAIDDVDVYGNETAALLRDIALLPNKPLLIVAIRSGKADRILNPAILESIPLSELTLPHLSDRDIGMLLDLLEREKKLGILTGKSRRDQESAFREQAGRQLLVAMYQATTGEKFEEKAFDELVGLQQDGQLIYSIIAVASAFRFGLSRDEILIACSDWTNVALNEVAQLIRRHIVTERGDGHIWARHRVIAEIILDELKTRGLLSRPVTGLARVAAAKVGDRVPRSARPWRMLRSFINHDFLMRTVGQEQARNLYGALENLLVRDFHFWLQRGSLEVELDNLPLAERYLAPDDNLVQTEWSYLTFRKAITHPGAGAADLVATATQTLEALMYRVGDPYPYHVLGSQGLAWARRALTDGFAKGHYLRRLLAKVAEGCKKYPRETELAQLYLDIQKEYLSIALPQ
jgi:hypothetical protein